MSDRPPDVRTSGSDDDERAPNPSFQADAMGATMIAYLVTGPALFGGIGWLIDEMLGLGVFTPIGVVTGMALSLYTIWLRYGRT